MDRVAIVGMAGKFPQADCVEEFWSNIQLGKDCITRKNSKEVLCRNTIKRVNARGCIRNVFDYDAEFLIYLKRMCGYQILKTDNFLSVYGKLLKVQDMIGMNCQRRFRYMLRVLQVHIFIKMLLIHRLKE